MIKFFRNVRKKLAAESNFAKYSRYAIGEILLVVVGILIALQINKNYETEVSMDKLEYFIQLYRIDLEENVEIFKEEKIAVQAQIDKNKKLLQSRQLDTIPLDSLEKWMETFYVVFDTDNFVHENFKNSQITDFGKYDSIINDMQRYYTWVYASIRGQLKQHNTEVDKSDEYWRYEQDEYELNYGAGDALAIQSRQERKGILIRLLEKPRARNILKADNRKKNFMVKLLDVWIEVSEESIAKIDATGIEGLSP